MRDILIASLLTLLPISELRGGIPFLAAKGYSLVLAYPLCVGLNFLVAPLTYVFLTTVHKLFSHMKWYMKLFDAVVMKARHKVEGQVEKYGYWGILLFVAIPLPITGAYTGTLGAWILGLSKRKTMLAVAGGVVISGLIVSAVVALGIEALDIFIKHIGA
ncbi:MAG: small multi-drug export protein [Spirochaetales bacterium]|nr:small multi-drug export protein [Spirochaetales bacterium]